MIAENTAAKLNQHIEVYKQVKISVAPAIADAFKKACAASKTSMAAELSRFMAEYSNTVVERKSSPAYTTRRKRRAAIQAMTKQLELIRDCEEEYRDRIPDNLHGSVVYDRADELVSLLDEVIDLIDTV